MGEERELVEAVETGVQPARTSRRTEAESRAAVRTTVERMSACRVTPSSAQRVAEAGGVEGEDPLEEENQPPYK